jgi:hypothetical protein
LERSARGGMAADARGRLRSAAGARTARRRPLRAAPLPCERRARRRRRRSRACPPARRPGALAGLTNLEDFAGDEIDRLEEPRLAALEERTGDGPRLGRTPSSFPSSRSCPREARARAAPAAADGRALPFGRSGGGARDVPIGPRVGCLNSSIPSTASTSRLSASRRTAATADRVHPSRRPGAPEASKTSCGAVPAPALPVAAA